MDAVKFIKEYERMCSSIQECNECPLDFLYREGICSLVPVKYPERAVSAVEKWSAEHPQKTRQSEFLKLFPNAKMAYGIIDICPEYIDENFECRNNYCLKCKKKYWLEEVE